MRYRLDVIGDNVTDLVSSAGGWIYDRQAAGWDVNVVLPEGADLRPLRILGARAQTIDALGRGLRGLGPRPNALATSVTLCATDPWVSAQIAQAMQEGTTEITLWGDQWPSSIVGPRGPVSHRLSVAGRAFKAQALAAVGESPLTVGKCEVFRTASTAPSWVGADLIPAG
ncbi:hypothetical protein QSJ18_05590 [Gordonia sp. ABSL1-1]|uniref:hypothetical protein n=1 Tax=Gordonia sp. ABSL1-1 TaxID=3053923 RepID=UPI00257421B8|nr:hypothetical protein [Gordonia sp. ABSL1-1]MDL9936208.1 hypothetical protein [Gordonia sp. ABSL1-1]